MPVVDSISKVEFTPEQLPTIEYCLSKEPTESDPVNNPSHYTKGEVECIDAIKASMPEQEFRGFLKGSTMKYVWRYEDKDNPIEDLDKADWYLTRLRERVRKDSHA